MFLMGSNFDSLSIKYIENGLEEFQSAKKIFLGGYEIIEEAQKNYDQFIHNIT